VGENEALTARLEELRADLRDHEEAEVQIQLQLNLAQDRANKDAKMLNHALDQERAAHEKHEAEVTTAQGAEMYRHRIPLLDIHVHKFYEQYFN